MKLLLQEETEDTERGGGRVRSRSDHIREPSGVSGCVETDEVNPYLRTAVMVSLFLKRLNRAV